MYLFWNSDERRLRAFWRLLLQFVVFILLWVAAAVVVAILKRMFPSAPLLAGQFSIYGPLWLVTLVSLYGVTRYIDRRPLWQLGLSFNRKSTVDYLLGIGAGTAVMALMFALEASLGLIEVKSLAFDKLFDPHLAGGLLDAFGACLFLGFGEEVIRNYQIRNVAEGLACTQVGIRGSVFCGAIVSSFVFGLLHGANPGITGLALSLLILAGFALCLGYILTGKAWFVVGFHTAWDFAEGSIFGYPVSGMPDKTSLIEQTAKVDPLITGGAFGPEGGLAGGFMLIVVALVILLWARWRTKRLHLWAPLCDWQAEQQT